MSIEIKYHSTALLQAPARETLAQAEADEARAIELAAYLTALETVTPEKWEAARAIAKAAERKAALEAAVEVKPGVRVYPAKSIAWSVVLISERIDAERVARFAAQDVAKKLPWDTDQRATWEFSEAATLAATAIVIRDQISPKQFAELVAPMQGIGIDFDKLV